MCRLATFDPVLWEAVRAILQKEQEKQTLDYGEELESTSCLFQEAFEFLIPMSRPASTVYPCFPRETPGLV